jgi:hypothetical protein
MANRIKSVTVQQERLSTLEAEMRIRVDVEASGHDAQVRGQLVGPKCPGVETVEVSYPLRPVQSGGPELLARVVVPEPNLWTEDRPFVYEGVVELWAGGVKRDAAIFTAAFKMN